MRSVPRYQKSHRGFAQILFDFEPILIDFSPKATSKIKYAARRTSQFQRAARIILRLILFNFHAKRAEE